MKISIKSAENAALINSGTDKEFSMKNLLRTKGKIEKPLSIKVRGNTVQTIFPNCTQIDTVVELSESYFRIDHVWIFTAAGEKQIGSFLYFPMENPNLFIPSVLFRENEKGAGCFPAGGIEKKFVFFEDRMPFPGCIVLFTSNRVIISCLDEPKKNFKNEPALVSAFVKGNNSVCALYLTGEEYPFSYQGKTWKVMPSEVKKYFKIPECSGEKPFTVKRSHFVYLYSKKNNLKSLFNTEKIDYNDVFSTYRSFIQKQLLHKNIKIDCYENSSSLLDWKNWFELKKRHLFFLSEDSMGPDNNNSVQEGAYIKMGKENGNIQSIYEFTGASFLIKSIEAALIFSETKNSSLAEKIGNFFLQAEQPALSGIFRDNYNLKTGEWGGYLGISENKTYASLVNARCNGEAMLAYIRLYESLLKQGIRKDAFINLAKRVASFYITHQMQDGSFGRWWTVNGKPVNTEGTNGAYIVCLLTALLPYYKKEEQTSIYNVVIKAGSYYCSLIENADYYADTLDADAFDKESAVILLRMTLDLYEYTGSKEYVSYACKAANFILTWVWFYNVPFPLETPLEKVRFLTAGMTSVSVAHHHLDFYGMYIARDFFRLSKVLDKTEADFYGAVGNLMLESCRQLIAQPESPLGKGKNLTGWQPEQVNHTAWDYFDRPGHQKGFFDVCIAWVPVLTLSAYLQICSEFPERLQQYSSQS